MQLWIRLIHTLLLWNFLQIGSDNKIISMSHRVWIQLRVLKRPGVCLVEQTLTQPQVNYKNYSIRKIKSRLKGLFNWNLALLLSRMKLQTPDLSLVPLLKWLTISRLSKSIALSSLFLKCMVKALQSKMGLWWDLQTCLALPNQDKLTQAYLAMPALIHKLINLYSL